MLFGKRVVDFMLVFTELFRYERISIENRRFRSNGSLWLKILGGRDRPPPLTILLVIKLG